MIILNLEIYSDDAVFDTLQSNWNLLLSRSRSDLIFLTHEWQHTWWQAYHPGDLHVVVARTDDGRLVGIAPWFIAQQDDLRVVHTIGCVDVTDYLDIIVDTAYEQDFFEALAEYVDQAKSTFDTLSLCNFPQQSPALEQWPGMLQQRGFGVHIEREDVCPIITLPSSWEEYLAQLNKKQRHELRRKMRRASGTTDWYIVGPDHDLSIELDRFLKLMAASSPEKADFLKNEQHAAFFRALTPLMMSRGWLQLSFLTADGQPAAAYLNFDRNNRIMVYNSGQDVEQFGSLSGGIVLLGHNIRHAIEDGRDEFDFLRGDEPYKYQMGGQDTEVFRLTAKRNQVQ
jgi:CelD/BcsL family acetyltransferase involved in cellulose biosynthesis